MLKRLGEVFGAPKTGTAKINGVASQFEGMINELETGEAMNYDRMAENTVEIDALENQNTDLSDTNVKARNIRDALSAIINGG
ncbi:MAG: hypothetical protein KAR39_04595 [Thermoplasmata archaeon]|nr:hypothetical protein [Thermoplasmata archaeon]